jgi:hypothetical protein
MTEETVTMVLDTANLKMFKETIRKYRTLDNVDDTVLSHSHKQIEKDIFCRLFELNTLAYNALDRKFYGETVLLRNQEKMNKDVEIKSDRKSEDWIRRSYLVNKDVYF